MRADAREIEIVRRNIRVPAFVCVCMYVDLLLVLEHTTHEAYLFAVSLLRFSSKHVILYLEQLMHSFNSHKHRYATLRIDLYTANRISIRRSKALKNLYQQLLRSLLFIIKFSLDQDAYFFFLRRTIALLLLHFYCFFLVALPHLPRCRACCCDYLLVSCKDVVNERTANCTCVLRYWNIKTWTSFDRNIDTSILEIVWHRFESNSRRVHELR